MKYVTRRRPRPAQVPQPTSLEICAGAGGAALGIERAGFGHIAVVEIDRHACDTLREPAVVGRSSRTISPPFRRAPFRGAVDLLAGGPPCTPYLEGRKAAWPRRRA